MSETKKFTEAELKEITELRNANAQKINEFGQIELEILLTNQRLEILYGLLGQKTCCTKLVTTSIFL